MMIQQPPATIEGATKQLTVGIFPATAKAGFRQDALRALSASLSHAGHCVEWIEGRTYRQCDLAVIYGYPGIGGAGKRHPVRQLIKAAHSGPVLIFETPLFGRKIPALKRGLLPFLTRRPDETFDRFRISLNGCFWDDGEFCSAVTDPSRWDMLRQDLNLDVKDYRRHGTHVLLAGQVPGDASLRGTDSLDWIERTAVSLATVTDRPIRIRPHPRSDHATLKSVMRRLGGFHRVTWDVEAGSSFRTALSDAWVTVTYSSGAAIDSLLAGIPAIALCPASMAWPVTDHDIGQVGSPTLFERRPWLDQLAHSQWTMSEIADGTVWARFEAKVLSLVTSNRGSAPYAVGQTVAS